MKLPFVLVRAPAGAAMNQTRTELERAERARLIREQLEYQMRKAWEHHVRMAFRQNAPAGATWQDVEAATEHALRTWTPQ